MPYATDGAIGISLTTTSADARHTLGERHTCSSGQVYLYVKASAAITQYWSVMVGNTFLALGTTKTLADLGYQPGIAMVAFAADEYGWVAIHGEGLTQMVLGSCDKGASLFSTSNTGVLDDATASQTKIWGAVLIASAGTTATTSVSASLINPHTQLAPTN